MHEVCNLYFALSVLADIVLGYFLVKFFIKTYKNKIIITENNREIYEHDKTIFNLEKRIEELEKALGGRNAVKADFEEVGKEL